MQGSLSCCGIACCTRDRRALDARVSQDQIRAVYDRIAPIYDLWGKLAESRARDRAIELANIKDGQHTLEVAVGTGFAFYEIVKRNPNGQNTGIDLSPGMLATAKKRLATLPAGNYSLEVGTAFDLSVASESVDLLMNNYMFDLIRFKYMDAILREFKRVLKKGGTLVLVNMTVGEKFGSRLYDRLYRISPKTMGGCRGVTMKDSLQRLGFTVETREYVQQLLFPSEVIVARK